MIVDFSGEGRYAVFVGLDRVTDWGSYKFARKAYYNLKRKKYNYTFDYKIFNKGGYETYMEEFFKC